MTDEREYPIYVASDEDIADFLARYGKPYDAENDCYDREVFVADIREGKNDPIYNAHSYHTKVPPRAIIPYILHYTEPGDIVLDPFCGSGMTGVAASLCEEPPPDILAAVPGAKKGTRRAILNDLSPAACHIAYNYCTPVEVEALKAEFDRIKAAVKDDLDWLYGTEHYEPAVGPYSLNNPEVVARLKNVPDGLSASRLVDSVERTWELLRLPDVESRLGYPVTDLPRDPSWGEIDIARVAEWICIPATIQYTIWSDVYRCAGFLTIEEPTGKISTRGKNANKPMIRKKRLARGCGRDIVLWDAAVDKPTGDVSEDFCCTNAGCKQKWKKIQLKRCAFVPVVSNYSYVGLMATKRGVQAVNRRTERNLSAKERRFVDEVTTSECPYWFPDERMDRKGPQYRRNALNARNIAGTRDFYTARNLWALALFWHQASCCESARIRRSIQFAVTSIALPMTRMYSYRANRKGGILKGSLYIPSLSQEMNVATALWAKIPDTIRLAEHRARFESKVVVCHGSSRRLSVPDASVDYVFTDPPFGSNIYYSEASHIWEAWLGKFTDRNEEAVVHRKNDGGCKRLQDYAEFMHCAFAEMFRVLKPGRWATVEFNNSDGAVFEAIKSAARSVGFAVENMVFLDKVQKTFKQLKGDKGEEDVVGHDVIFNLRRPAAACVVNREDGVGPSATVASHEFRSESLEHVVAAAVRQHLGGLPDRITKDSKTYTDEHRTTPFLNTVLMNALIPQGVNVERLNLPYIERVCGRYFRKVDNRWYLPDEAAVQEHSASSRGLLFRAPMQDVEIRDEASALAWLRGRLNNGGMRIGELRPHWMRATVKLTGNLSTRLEHFLREHFWLDRQTHRWRMPTPDELEQMDDTEQRRARHEAERFLAGSSRHAPSDAMFLDWIDHLYRSATRLEEEAAGLAENGQLAELPDDAKTLYNMMLRLMSGVLKERVEDSDLALAQRQCRIARAKLAAQEERELAASRAAAPQEDLPLFANLDLDE